MIFVDTSIAIGMRDVDMAVHGRVAQLDTIPVISMLTRIELENGIWVSPTGAAARKSLLDRFLQTISVVMYDKADIRAYGEIVSALGFSRRLIVDRMIAAQAVARDAMLITANGLDFRDVPGLRLEVW